MKALKVLLSNYIPIVIMVWLIALIQNDYLLLVIYLLFTLVSLSIYREKKEVRVFLLGLVMLTISEYIFVSTGVETFNRTSLFGIMPIWLPVLWGFGFVSIKRTLPLI